MSSITKCFNARFAALAAGVALLGGASAAQATIVYATNFNSPTYSDGPIAGQDSWTAISGIGTNSVAVANTGTNGNVRLTTTGEDVRRNFGPAITTGSVYLTATITLSAAQATGDYFLHLGDGSATIFNARIYAKSAPGGFVMAMGTGAGAGVTYGSTVLSFGTTYTILARYDLVAGLANDTGALFVNPTDAFGIGDTAYVAATTIGIDAVTFSSVSLRQGTAANAATLVIDNIDVSIIPTPGAAALLGLGGLMASRRRRA